MAAPKSRLGRGLGGLIAAAAPTPAKPDTTAKSAPAASAAAAPAGAPGFQEVAVHLIEPSPYQARREISPEQLSELAESIRSEGLLQPIVVRKHADKFQLIAGERRWRAFQMLKIKTIPARVVEASNASSAALGLIENLQREGLNPIEEAYGYASLIRDFDLTQEATSERVGEGPRLRCQFASLALARCGAARLSLEKSPYRRPCESAARRRGRCASRGVCPSHHRGRPQRARHRETRAIAQGRTKYAWLDQQRTLDSANGARRCG